jgi:hypothetical protein
MKKIVKEYQQKYSKNMVLKKMENCYDIITFKNINQYKRGLNDYKEFMKSNFETKEFYFDDNKFFI